MSSAENPFDRSDLDKSLCLLVSSADNPFDRSDLDQNSLPATAHTQLFTGPLNCNTQLFTVPLNYNIHNCILGH